MLTGKKVKLTAEEKLEKMLMKDLKRDRIEKQNLGGYRLIYPVDDQG